MRIRSVYFKVADMNAELAFWQAFLEREPLKRGSHWSEFMVGETRLGMLLNDFGEELQGCAAVPVFELAPEQLAAAVSRAKAAGATVVLDGLGNPQMNAIVLASSGGHEFELCNCAAHG